MPTVYEAGSSSPRIGPRKNSDADSPVGSGTPSLPPTPATLRDEGQGDGAAGSLVVRGKSGLIRVRIASSHAELGQAFALLAAHYRARGIDRLGGARYCFTPYHMLPETVTLVAEREGVVSATMSLVPDTSLLGLPLERVHGAEVAELRRQGRRLAELTSLADAGLTCIEFVQVFSAFIRIAMHYHLQQGGDSWVIAINPRHRNFYLRLLGFVPLGPRRNDPSVEHLPAEAFLLDVPLMSTNSPELHQRIFAESLPQPALTPPPWSADSVRHFAENANEVDRRTVDQLLLSIEHLGSPPRWRELDQADPARTGRGEPPTTH